MFTDEAKIYVKAGKGGDGCVHFRREKFLPKGGPDGGNGGKGGNVIFEAISNIHTLSDFRSKKIFAADNGKAGDKCDRTGANGDDLVISVPVGTQIRHEDTEKIICDLVHLGQRFKIARGGVGGKGNAGFVNSIRQAPNFAEKGDLGEELALELELKLVADVALVGYPSVGKSTFISVVTNAKPKVAEYHFTTLVPNLGVGKVDDRDLVFIDVPGLIEGAHEGKGLGHQFLRHIQRASYVLHLIDGTSDTPVQDFEILQKELKSFSSALAEKPFVIVLSKADLIDDEWKDFLKESFKDKTKAPVFVVSSATHEGVDPLLKHLISEIPEEVDMEIPEIMEKERVDFRPGQEDDDRRVKITKMENWWDLQNQKLSQMARQTDWENREAQERIYDVLRKWGTLAELQKQGALPGSQLHIGENFLVFRGL